MLSEMMNQMGDTHTLAFTSILLSLIAIILLILTMIIFNDVPRLNILPNFNSFGSAEPLPGPSFCFPNGQGTEKFFNGRDAAKRWRNRYGSIYGIWSGFKREIVITRPDHVRIFYKDSHTHIKASDNNSGWLFGELLGSCVGVVSQKRWVRVRAPFEHHFTRPASLLKSQMFINEARSFLQKLHEMKTGDENLTINATNDLKYCPFFMVASIFFGPLTVHQRSDLYKIGPLRESLFRDAFSGGINRYSFGKRLPGSAMLKLREFQRLWEDFIMRAHSEAILGNVGAIVPLWEAVERAEISKEETLDESLFANLDVTAHALSWNILRISQHTDIQKELWQEIWANSQSEKSYEHYLQRDNTLLAACILEASRLHPILPFSNPEAPLMDKFVGEYKISRNTDVIVDTYAINVDNPYWENSVEFDPRRHLNLKDQSRRYNMWRFGFGPRQCLGKNVADIILRVIVAEILREYHIDIVGGRNLDEIELQTDSWIGLPDGVVSMTLRQIEL